LTREVTAWIEGEPCRATLALAFSQTLQCDFKATPLCSVGNDGADPMLTARPGVASSSSGCWGTAATRKKLGPLLSCGGRHQPNNLFLTPGRSPIGAEAITHTGDNDSVVIECKDVAEMTWVIPLADDLSC